MTAAFIPATISYIRSIYLAILNKRILPIWPFQINNRSNAEQSSHELGEAEVLRDQAERLRELEAENARLTREVAVLTVDKLILREVAKENGRGSARKYPSGR